MSSGLFSTYRIRSASFRNRLWVSPMCQYAVDREDGVPTDWHLVHLGSFARGGAGLVMTEATAVTADGRIAAEDTGIYTQAQRDAWVRIVAFIHSQGAHAGIQLAHAGRKASTWREWGPRKGTRPVADGGWQTVAPSAIPFATLDLPRELTVEDIGGIVKAFADGARRAVAAGFDVVEVHAAHGYLLHQFLSPLANTRSDEYGGTLENRARLLVEVVSAVRDAVGETVPLFVRLSATDWAPEGENGWDPEQTATVARWAADAGGDLFDISSGGILGHAQIPLGPGYQVHLAEYVRQRASVPVSTVGLITESAQADAIITDGRADAVMMGRELLRDPHFPLRAAHELGVEIDYFPRIYHRARWS
ncbi:MAG TPA: NADH:flavin oxidoreductase/NADH oxidase [Homoserinimonas sp.]|nr:NADH:flavin oxidoreductase/NADH oxidase [Homoserinimonas sp.]